jgi:hypothetical protein
MDNTLIVSVWIGIFAIVFAIERAERKIVAEMRRIEKKEPTNDEE